MDLLFQKIVWGNRFQKFCLPCQKLPHVTPPKVRWTSNSCNLMLDRNLKQQHVMYSCQNWIKLSMIFLQQKIHNKPRIRFYVQSITSKLRKLISVSTKINSISTFHKLLLSDFYIWWNMDWNMIFKKTFSFFFVDIYEQKNGGRVITLEKAKQLLSDYPKKKTVKFEKLPFVYLIDPDIV